MKRSELCLIAVVAAALFHPLPGSGADARELKREPGGKTRMAISPLAGVNRNEMKVRGERGEIATETDTAAEYGLFFLLTHRNLVLTDFVFFTEVNDTDVFGNFVFANLYGDRSARATWNAGAGHLYHKIEPRNEDITIHVPMLKAGPVFSIPEWGLTVNPYVGYAWERIETSRADVDNDSYLYGLTVSWRWRMAGATVKYYYQDSRGTDDDFQTARARAHMMFTEHWGAVIRFDYMEHATSDDTSALLGPIYVF